MSLWYKRYPADAYDGMRCLNLQEIGAYNTVLDLIYARGVPVYDDERFLAGMMGCRIDVWRRIRGRLIELGKLISIDGKLTNRRAERELELRREWSERSSRGGKISSQKLNTTSQVVNGLRSGCSDFPVSVCNENNDLTSGAPQPLKTKNQTESLIREESKIIDIRPTADSRLPAGEFDWESSDGTIFVSADQINRWSQMFPGVNVRAQLRGARREYLAGPMQTEVFCRRFEKGLRTKAEKKRLKEQQSIEHKTVARDTLGDEYELRQRALAVRKRHLGG